MPHFATETLVALAKAIPAERANGWVLARFVVIDDECEDDFIHAFSFSSIHAVGAEEAIFKSEISSIA